MVAGSFSVFALIMMLVSGGSNDLLDYVSTDYYWRAKGVPHVTAQQLLDELKPPAAGPDIARLIASLGAAGFEEREKAAAAILKHGPSVIPQLERATRGTDAEVASRATSLIQQLKVGGKGAAVRKLMAIRTLGEMKKAEAIPALKALLDSKEMFVADYARAAIAQVEGKPLPPRTPPQGAMKTDLSLLPANCGAVGQVAMAVPDGAKRVSIEEALKQLPQMPGEDPQKVFEEMQQSLLAVAEKVGNVRVHGATIGVSDDVGDRSGFVAVVLRGEYDAAAVPAALRDVLPAGNAVDGVEMFSPEKQIAFGFPSDQRALFIAGPNQEQLPVKALLTAVRDNKGPLMTNAELAKLIATVDTSAPMWAVCKVNDNYRQADVINAFDTITFVSRHEKDSTNFIVKGIGSDAARVQAAVAMVNRGLNDARQHLPQMAQQMPMFKPIADLVAGAKCEATDKEASFIASVPGTGNAVMALPVFFFGARAHAVEAKPAIRN